MSDHPDTISTTERMLTRTESTAMTWRADFKNATHWLSL